MVSVAVLSAWSSVSRVVGLGSSSDVLGGPTVVPAIDSRDVSDAGGCQVCVALKPSADSLASAESVAVMEMVEMYVVVSDVTTETVCCT